MSVRLAIIGDVHLHFNEHDVSYFNRSDYDLVLFVGDLVNYAPWRGAQVWSLIQQLNKPTLFMPGNHDGTNVFQLIAEVLGYSALARVTPPFAATACIHLKSAGLNLISLPAAPSPWEVQI